MMSDKIYTIEEFNKFMEDAAFDLEWDRVTELPLKEIFSNILQSKYPEMELDGIKYKELESVFFDTIASTSGDTRSGVKLKLEVTFTVKKVVP